MFEYDNVFLAAREYARKYEVYSPRAISNYEDIDNEMCKLKQIIANNQRGESSGVNNILRILLAYIEQDNQYLKWVREVWVTRPHISGFWPRLWQSYLDCRYGFCNNNLSRAKLLFCMQTIENLTPDLAIYDNDVTLKEYLQRSLMELNFGHSFHIVNMSHGQMAFLMQGPGMLEKKLGIIFTNNALLCLRQLMQQAQELEEMNSIRLASYRQN